MHLKSAKFAPVYHNLKKRSKALFFNFCVLKLVTMNK